MANNYYPYGNYPYYNNQSQEQNHTQPTGTHSQAYQNSSTNPYASYSQYNANQYAQQSSDRTHQQYQSRSSIDTNPTYGSANFYPQQYASTAKNDTSAAYNYATATQPTSGGYSYGGQNAIDQNKQVFSDNSALNNLAYASASIGGRSSTSTINPSTNSQQQQLYHQQQQQQQQQSQGQSQQSSQQQQQQQQQQGSQQQSSSILPQPTHQQSYGQSSTQKTQATTQIPPQSLYRNNAVQQQRSTPTSAAIRRSPSLPIKQNSISHQSSHKGISPHGSNMESMQTTSSRPSMQSSNAHQISNIMNPNQDLTTSKTSQQAPSHMMSSQMQNQMQNHAQNQMVVENRSPANAVQSPAIEQPQTINPNELFMEPWGRRREVESAAAKRLKEHKVPTPIQPPPASIVQPSQTMIQPVSTPLQTPQTSTPDQSKSAQLRDSPTEEEIKSEMRSFAVKLKGWKSVYPAGAAAVDDMWRQTLSATFNTSLLSGRTSSQTPQMSRSSVPGKYTPRIDTSGFGDDDSGLASPFQPGGPDDLPDLGKFPAMRRRTRADKGVSRSAKAGQVAAARAITQSNQTPVSTLQYSTQTPIANDAAGADTMRRAMQAFHQTPTPATPDPVTPVTTAPKSKGPSTVWPEERKPAIALATKDFVESQPANIGKEITTEAILSMLNQNPTYDNFCQMLANYGLSVHRSNFAQVLLEIVPSNGSKANNAAATNEDDTPAKKPRGRPKKNSMAASTQEPLAQQGVDVAVKWPSNLGQTNLAGPDGRPFDLTNGDGVGYNAFYKEMSHIHAQSPAQMSTALQQPQPTKKRNVADMGNGSNINGGSVGKKQQTERPGGGKSQHKKG